MAQQPADGHADGAALVARERAKRPGMPLALGPPVPDTNAPRVLVIDDDPDNRDSVQALLEYFGYECGIAADGPSGLKRFEGVTWDLVITDLMLRGMMGWQVIDAIRGGNTSQVSPTCARTVVSVCSQIAVSRDEPSEKRKTVASADLVKSPRSPLRRPASTGTSTAPLCDGPANGPGL